MNPVVLDTCVLISGLLSPFGASGALLSAFFDNRLKLAYTGDILAEYAGVMERAHFHIEQSERIAIIMKLRATGLRITPAPVPAIDWPDKKDIPFIAAALATEGKTVITLNPRDFEPAKSCGLRVLSPAQAITLLHT
jgi:putative PIN family toxin of toxin-antitoxin system